MIQYDVYDHFTSVSPPPIPSKYFLAITPRAASLQIRVSVESGKHPFVRLCQPVTEEVREENFSRGLLSELIHITYLYDARRLERGKLHFSVKLFSKTRQKLKRQRKNT